jgi:PTH1 family peptidyl-tRNA hydrolase
MADYDGWVVFGLGNPGAEYQATRHNIGYNVLDELASRMGGRWRPHRSGRVAAIEGRLAGVPGVRTVLGRARSYMNESGGPVSSLLSFYKAPPERLVVVQDEIDLPYGVLRVKFGGGDNGHNGLKSIRGALGTGEFYRVRVGVGRPAGRRDTADHVLAPFTSAERRELDLHVQRAADAVESLVTDGLERTQSQYNS